MILTKQLGNFLKPLVRPAACPDDENVLFRGRQSVSIDTTSIPRIPVVVISVALFYFRCLIELVLLL